MTRRRRRDPKRTVGKHQPARWQRERKMQRIALIVGILGIAVILGIAAYGLYGLAAQ